jgi:hypothetical protein
MTDKLEQLEGLLGDLGGAVDRRRLGDRLNQSMQTLSTADYQIDRLKAVLELAGLTGLDKGGQGQVVQKLREEAWETGDWLEKADTDDELRDAVLEYDKVLLRSLANCEITVRNNWKTSAAQRFRPQVALGELLRGIGVEPELGEKLVETGQRALRAGDLTPASAMCEEVKSLLEEQDELQAERSERISKGEIGEFITALAEHRATLSMVSSEVEEWLRENNALDRFRVEPRFPGSPATGFG